MNGIGHEPSKCVPEKTINDDQMTTERTSFGLNSLFPSSCRTKAEAFAKCLHDKLKSLGGKDDIGKDNTLTNEGILSKYTDEEICNSVFLQGNLAFRRPTIPNHQSVSNGIVKLTGGVVDRRGFSSDSDDSDNDIIDDITIIEEIKNDNLGQVCSSLDSNTSWCSCIENVEDLPGELASQVKGPPPIRTPRRFNKKRFKPEKTAPPLEIPQDLFFELDGLSPVGVDSDDDTTDLKQISLDISTPPPSPTIKTITQTEFLIDDNEIEDLSQGICEEAEREEKTEVLNENIEECVEVTEDSALEELAKKIEAATCKEEKYDGQISQHEDDESSPRLKLRRCSSLKSWKTPPGTPGSKKIVRFADALGLDLADVRMFRDEIPKVPSSAYRDLEIEIEMSTSPEVRLEPSMRTLIPMFQQPGIQLDFMDRVTRENVCLERANLSDTTLLSITGLVRVRNLCFNKSVHIRYSKDHWLTFSDLQATYVPGSSDGFTDQFSFVLYGHTLNIGDRIEFAIKFESSPEIFWDSNDGVNYVFQCMPQHNSFTPSDVSDACGAFY